MPGGEIIDLGNAKHIDLVIADPEIFSESEEQIHADYEYCNEPVGFEGRARHAIILRILKRGFVRIRERRNSWVAECWSLSGGIKVNLSAWANMVRDGYDIYDGSMVELHELGKPDKLSKNILLEDFDAILMMPK